MLEKKRKLFQFQFDSFNLPEQLTKIEFKQFLIDFGLTEKQSDFLWNYIDNPKVKTEYLGKILKIILGLEDP